MSCAFTTCSTTPIHTGYLPTLVTEIRNSIFTLENNNVPEQRLEEMAIVVYKSMSAESRSFHVVQHVFDLSADGADEIQKLAAFFHDCIYYTVDGGLSPMQQSYLNGAIFESKDGIYLTKNPPKNHIELVTEIFGFTNGQQLIPFQGLNEYLSSVLAVQCYGDFLSLRHLLEVIACIEASIPFRSGDVMEDLYERLVKVNEKYDINMNGAELETAVVRAADFANRDIKNFSTTNPNYFVSNTWKIIFESNNHLRTQVFSISELALAVQKTTEFFRTLKAETVFSSFRDQPSKEQIIDLTQKAKGNIEISLTYMKCKLLSIAVIAAFAELSGGDAPIALFLGDFPDSKYDVKKEAIELDHRVLTLLKEEQKRSGSADFDIENRIPFTALLYAEIGDVGLEESLKYVVNPMDEEHAKSLLRSLPINCVTEIGFAFAHNAVTRSQAIRNIVQEMKGY